MKKIISVALTLLSLPALAGWTLTTNDIYNPKFLDNWNVNIGGEVNGDQNNTGNNSGHGNNNNNGATNPDGSRLGCHGGYCPGNGAGSGSIWYVRRDQ